MLGIFSSKNIIRLLFVNVLFTGEVISAEKDLGRESYLQVCSACHGPNGKGLKIEGAEGFPPLAGSTWLKGDPDRIAQIILHGLQDPISVKGKKYNQIMPQQGALSDETALAVINYVRTEFAGEKGSYHLNDLKKARALSKDRKTQWTAKELLKLYPLPRPKSPIKHLIMQSYTGAWTKLPDFQSLEAEAVEEEHDGYISLKKINEKSNFGLVWIGELEVTKDGEHQFELNSDDGSKLSIDGKEVARVKGLGAMNRHKKGKLKLKKGLYKFRLEYFQNAGGKGISLRHKAPEQAWQWLSDPGQLAEDEVKVTIDLTPKDGRVRMYNNFIKGSSPRTMGVGYPLGNNIAFSTEDCNLDLIWKGNFISAGRHWTRRGQGFEAPMSKQIIPLSRGVAWSSAASSALLKVQFNGIQTNKMGSPTFGYTVGGGIKVKESFISSTGSLERMIEIQSGKNQKITLKVAESGSLQDNTITIGTLNLKIPVAQRISKKNKSYYITLDLLKGTNQLNLTYSWKK